jgi:transcriptional regulator with XRE-family HTH domain
MERFGEKLRQLRTRNGWSMADLAPKLEITRAYIGRMERGEKIPNAAMILKIADIFNISIDRLMRDELELDE